jgi:putative ABC transport system ATP-binding protein
MIRQWLQHIVGQRSSPNGHQPDTDGYLLELRDVVKEYPIATGTIAALKGVSLQIRRGEFVAVLGKSGSGKSTLMNMITGVDRPTRGEVLVGSTAVHTLNEEQLTAWRGRNVGVIYQSFYLLPTLTVIENVMIPLDVGNTCHPRDFRTRALHLLEQVDMAEHADKLPSATSGGQQQRIAIARAMANDPPLIVADEPTGSLDSKTADAIFKMFEHLVAQGTTVVMVTHDNELAERAGRKIVLVDGQIVDRGYEEAQEHEDQKTVPA